MLNRTIVKAIVIALLIFFIPVLYMYHSGDIHATNVENDMRSNTVVTQGYSKASRTDISIDGDFRDWTFEDLVSLDPVITDRYNFNDGLDDSRDIMACYVHITQESVYFRIDLYDLGFGAEINSLDIYVTVDFADGGQEWLPDFTDCKTDTPWEVAVGVYDSNHYVVYYPDWTYHNDTFLGVAYNSQWDCVEFGISTKALEDNGYLPSMPIRFQFFTTKDGTNNGPGEIPMTSDITDAVPNDFPWEDGYLNGSVDQNNGIKGEVKFAIIHHGNQFIKNITDFVRDANGLGFWKVPEIHEKWHVPVNLHISGTLAEAIEWFRPEFNDYIRSLVDKGIVHMVGGFYSEYIPQYVPQEVNLWSMSYAKWQIAYYYNDTHVPICWIPERVFWDGYEYLVKMGGYEAVIVDTEDGFVWYCEPSNYSNEHKLYVEDNGLKVLFISNRGQAGAPYNIQDQMHNSHDGGLSITMREGFLNIAMDGDDEQYILYMDDWEKTCGNIPLWGGAEVVASYENSIGWIANHPWIKTVAIEELLSLTPAGEIDINDCSYFWLRYKTGGLGDPATAPYDNHNLYDAWYYDPLGEIAHVDYFNYTPKDCNMPLGDYKTPNTIIGETWSLIKQIPSVSPVYELAMKTFSTMLYETAWFEQWGSEPLYMPYWQKEQAAHIRTAAIYYYVNQWLNLVDKGTKAMAIDVDLDGSDEYILYNNRIYCIFERRGGKLAYAFDSNGREIIGNPPTGWLDEGDAMTDAITSTTTNTHYSGDMLGMGENAGEEYLMGSKTYTFSDMGYENEIYVAVVDSLTASITFTHGPVMKRFQLDGTKVIGTYTLGQEFSGYLGIRFTFTPDLRDVLVNGTEHLVTIGSSAGAYFGWDNDGVCGAVTLDSNVVYTGHGSNAMARYVEVKALAKDFAVIVHISELNISTTNTPPEVELLGPADGAILNNTTPTFMWIGFDADGDMITYTLYVSKDPEIAAEDIMASDIDATEYTIPSTTTLEYNTTYYWTVIPKDTYGYGICLSGIWHFRIRPEAKEDGTIYMPVVEVSNPENNSIVEGTVIVAGIAYHTAIGMDIVSVELDFGSGWTSVDELSSGANGTWYWSYNLNTTPYENGPMMIYIRAFDGTNYSSILMLHITINNTPIIDENATANATGTGGNVSSPDEWDKGKEQEGVEDTEDNGTAQSGESEDLRGRICYNVTVCFVLPMLVIVIVGLFIETLIQRRKRRG